MTVSLVIWCTLDQDEGLQIEAFSDEAEARAYADEVQANYDRLLNDALCLWSLPYLHALGPPDQSWPVVVFTRTIDEEC